MSKVIAVGGLQHETNTFAPILADYHAFVIADGWPPLCRGEDLLREIDGIHLPITGACDYLCSKDAILKPLLWASATPSAHVTEDAFETLATMLIEDLQAIRGDIDGVYLDLHGAMVCQHFEDGEGELLRRIREVIGDSMPLTMSLDLHANVTKLMVECCDYIDIFRTYPHIDMAETGERAAEELLAILAGKAKPFKAFRQADFAIPLCEGCTFHGAAQGLYDEDLPSVMADYQVQASIACGFSLADIYDMGPSVLAYGDSPESADSGAEALLKAMQTRFADNKSEYVDSEMAVKQAQDSVHQGVKPIVIADVQDNPGGGGTGDTTGLLRALLAGDIASAVLASVYDSDTADKLHRHNIGDIVPIELGGKLFEGDTPIAVEAEILNLTDGVFTGTGPMWLGARIQLGKMALVQIGKVRVIIQSRNLQAADRSILHHMGINDKGENIIALKSSVHYRADFQPIAAKIITAIAKGAVFADISKLKFKNIRPNLQLPN